MPCKTCNSDRIVSFGGKSSDLNVATIGEKEHEGYVPHDMNIGGGDYVEFKFCLNCGQIQGTWPRPETSLERGDNEY